MTEELPEYLPVEFSTAKRLKITADEQRRDDLTFGAPERHIIHIHNVIRQALKDMNIDPRDVLVAGYRGDDPDAAGLQKIDEMVDTTTADLETTAREANRLYSEGHFEDHPEEQQFYKDRIQFLRNELKNPRPRYYFARIVGLELGSDPNPTDYAGVGTASRIGIYDKAKLLDLLGAEDEGDIVVVPAMPDQIEATKIATVHLPYTDEAGRPIDS